MTTQPIAVLPRRVIVVGAGLAGLRTVAELRGQGFDGDITVVSAEHLAPYDRPPLTKELFSRPEPLWLANEGYGELSALADHVLLGHRATALQADDDGARLTITGGSGEVAGDVVVLAVGARPIVPPGWQDARSLHDAEDAAHLREHLVPGSRLVIVGGGWIGAELATVAAQRDVAVTVVEAEPAPLAQVLGPEVSTRMLPWY
ncbi:MAG TPA: FAD/NAD(P)-binding oxidoreductase, partial [Actinomycetaceae bacterium]|nr:FAD/NAD(P)-binding oxidoreductase [Actinomycetaceae bacterium]